MNKPPQIVCRCAARLFPHREDQYCRSLRDELENSGPFEEYADERRYIDADRAADANSGNRRYK